jgi:ribosome-associated protein
MIIKYLFLDIHKIDDDLLLLNDMLFFKLRKEVKYRTSRSGGAGGQNVNKVSTKVELLFDVMNSEVLTDSKKIKIISKLKNRISQDGILSLQCDETRSQLTNKEIVFERFINLIKTALTPVKKRRPTKPTRSSVKKRLNNKKKHSEKKSNRKFKDE